MGKRISKLQRKIILLMKKLKNWEEIYKQEISDKQTYDSSWICEYSEAFSVRDQLREEIERRRLKLSAPPKGDNMLQEYSD